MTAARCHLVALVHGQEQRATLLLIDHLARGGYVLAALAGLGLSLGLWYERDLAALPPASNQGFNGRLSGDILRRLDPAKAIDAEVLWMALKNHWQALFFTNRFLLPIPGN